MNSLMRWLRSFEVERLRKREEWELQRRCLFADICFTHGNPLVTFSQCALCRTEWAIEQQRLSDALKIDLNKFHGRS